MPELPRTRDCIVLVKGETYPVTVSDAMATSGWRGGQGLQWATPLKDEFLVEITDGSGAGFALFGSDESSDQFTAMTRNQSYYKFVTFCLGGWQISTSTYEKYTYASRVGAGPLVPLTYSVNDQLVFSLRGYWTKEDEWTLSGDPRAPQTFYVGRVTQAPSTLTSDYLDIQVSL